MGINKRRITAMVTATMLGAGAATLTSAVAPVTAVAEAEAKYGHQHDEPDGSVFCHCGTGNCYPCGGGEETLQ